MSFFLLLFFHDLLCPLYHFMDGFGNEGIKKQAPFDACF